MLKVIQGSGGDASLIHIPDHLDLGYPAFVPAYTGTLLLKLYGLDGSIRQYEGSYSGNLYTQLTVFLNTVVAQQLDLLGTFSIPVSGDTVHYLNVEGFTTHSSINIISRSLLDVATNASTACSLRRLRAAYTGDVLCVRRGGDNVEANIGFDDAGRIDAATLENFLDGADGYVAIWYDQSGSGNHMKQTNAGAQPRITVHPVAGAQIESDGLNDYMEVVAANAIAQPYTITAVAKVGGASTQNHLVAALSTENSSVLQIRKGGSSQINLAGYLYNYTWQEEEELITLSRNNAATAGSLHINGIEVVPFTQFANGNGIKRVTLFAESNAAGNIRSNYGLCALREIIFWGSAAGDLTASHTGIESNINWYYNIF